MTRHDLDILEAIWAMPQPEPDEPIQYHICHDALGQATPGGPRPRHERGVLQSYAHLRELMLTMSPDSFIILSPARPDWFSQAWCGPEGWQVELGLWNAERQGNDIQQYQTEHGSGFSLASAHAMLCQLIARQRLDLPTGFTLLEF